MRRRCTQPIFILRSMNVQQRSEVDFHAAHWIVWTGRCWLFVTRPMRLGWMPPRIPRNRRDAILTSGRFESTPAGGHINATRAFTILEHIDSTGGNVEHEVEVVSGALPIHVKAGAREEN